MNSPEEEPDLNEHTLFAVVTDEKGPKLSTVRHALEEGLPEKYYQELMRMFKDIIREALDVVKKGEYSEEQIVMDLKVFVGEERARQLLVQVKEEK